jgi:hypothetical protein
LIALQSQPGLPASHQSAAVDVAAVVALETTARARRPIAGTATVFFLALANPHFGFGSPGACSPVRRDRPGVS